jgi:hypothetical protein
LEKTQEVGIQAGLSHVFSKSFDDVVHIFNVNVQVCKSLVEFLKVQVSFLLKVVWRETKEKEGVCQSGEGKRKERRWITNLDGQVGNRIDAFFQFLETKKSFV